MAGLTAVHPPAGAVVGTLLDWARDLMEPALRDAVTALPERESRIAGYHRGWHEADGGAREDASSGRGGGKAVRPALVLLAAKAVGAPAACAVPGAVGVELIHDFSLLHDDVIDGDALRRHRPAAWTVYGTPAAVLTGDALLVTALQVLAAAPSSAAGAAVREALGMLGELMRGQSQDVSFETSGRVATEQYLAMAEGKTGALMGCACALGGLLGGAREDRVAGLRDFGRCLGVAFQCVDDLLGIWGTSGRSGKPVGADLAARKKSLPVVAALADDGPAGRRLAALYAQADPFGEAEIALATTLIEEAGGRERTEQQVQRQTSAAMRALTRAEPAAEVYRQMQEIAALLTGRDH
ncbi:polyprenyl synthetase family protein [Streptomyces caatingaensis]|uniref:Dimethylallyltranstransferase n=1 Tax=Streptomyces caatingaensis TaxID=1678637 RepID=A0A0K9XG21_9ACTN|nr:polyprenyl synthetase family protein [Streptomyces caatingaensis]KNB52364.1 dimethylallyltranstransferase [Streptomyces caatingaensis]